ncbi:ROK family protein [Moorella sp. Hama-1]|uniref:ROK family protein n=1 Tax=Moorella sp. Hama-1 TaxID=2138101 RepID=UPI00137B8A63|nr:ROK family protein [Moorella sp. Hama-1]MDN5362355.1 glucokinase [Moorella sp. (in: firmicutes)]BCV20653.1 glucokinase [Moorella sp. Hama-1]
MGGERDCKTNQGALITSKGGTNISEKGSYVLGVDLGGTKIAFGLVDQAGQVVKDLIVPTCPGEGAMGVIQRIIAGLRQVAAAAGDRQGIKGIGIVVPGVLDVDSGRVVLASNLNWRDVPISAILEKELNLPLFLENDARAAAWGEKCFGQGRRVEDLLYIAIGTGIGGGLILGGRIYRGHHGNAGEIGHMVIDPEGPLCGCGNRGCWEALASGRAIANRAAALLAAGRPSSLGALAGRGEEVTALHVATAAAAGDELALEVMGEAARYIGLGIASLVTIFDPELVVLGGGVSRNGSLLLATVTRVVRQRALPPAAGDVQIVLSTWPEMAGVVGAAAVAFSRLGLLDEGGKALCRAC